MGPLLPPEDSEVLALKLKNCKRCGKLFVFNGVDLCPDCLQEDEEDFRKVKDYLYHYPKSTVFEISEATGVSTEKIWDFFKQGKLELADKNSGISLTCERCGKPIRSGRFCNECLKTIRDRFETLSAEEQQEYENGKFHISDRIKKDLNK